jgi:DtxR family Mn-dependent transcriptional regulator
MNSFTEENYIKAIYKLTEKYGDTINTNAIAEKTNTKAASVTDMLKRLSSKELINYKKYKGVTLTAKGEKLALNIIRKHRLWEMFLVVKLGFKWDEVHEIAEELEHINSEKLIEQLDQFLDYPKVDPHGDPIPDAKGKVNISKSLLLAKSNKNITYTMTGVVDHSPTFLKYLEQSGITLGCSIKIKDIVEFDNSLHIMINKRKNIFISNEVAKNILALKKTE